MKKNLHRCGLWLGASLCLFMLALTAAIAAPVARADQPEFFPLHSFDFVFSSTTCGFPVAAHFVLNGEVLRVFSNGDALITGPLSAQYSANGKTVSVNISGPLRFTVTPVSVTFVAQGIGGGLVQTANGVTLAVIAGLATIDPTTGLPTLEHGHVLVNLCDALAPS